MAEKLLANHETLKLLDDDEVVELFKATVLSPSSVQVHRSTAAVARRATDVLRRCLKTPRNFAPNRKLTPLAFSGKSVDFSKVIATIDEMETLPRRNGVKSIARRRSAATASTRQ